MIHFSLHDSSWWQVRNRTIFNGVGVSGSGASVHKVSCTSIHSSSVEMWHERDDDDGWFYFGWLDFSFLCGFSYTMYRQYYQAISWLFLGYIYACSNSVIYTMYTRHITGKRDTIKMILSRDYIMRLEVRNAMRGKAGCWSHPGLAIHYMYAYTHKAIQGKSKHRLLDWVWKEKTKR